MRGLIRGSRAPSISTEWSVSPIDLSSGAAPVAAIRSSHPQARSRPGPSCVAPKYRVMISIKSCTKCGAAVCACGFLPALVVSIFGDGKPPPSRAVGPIAAQFSTTTPLTGTVALSRGVTAMTDGRTVFLTVADEITGKVYSAPWSQKQQQELDAPPPLTSSAS
jgi:hypothetical protein